MNLKHVLHLSKFPQSTAEVIVYIFDSFIRHLRKKGVRSKSCDEIKIQPEKKYYIQVQPF